jgi:hypothetical protein
MREMRRALLAGFLSASLGSFVLVGCGAAPNAQATQTRTSEIVELTVSARLLPTQNVAVPPTPIPATPTSSLPISTPIPVSAAANPGNASATSEWATINAIPYGGTDLNVHTPPQSGSWVAYSPAIHVRFFAPPSLIEDPEFTNDHRYSLSSPSNVFDFETLDIFRVVGARGGDFASTWQSEVDAYSKGNAEALLLTVTSGPRQQQVAAYQGNIGQFHYAQTSNQLRIDGTMWVGQVGGDEVEILYRSSDDRAAILDGELAQVLATIDFNAH